MTGKINKLMIIIFALIIFTSISSAQEINNLNIEWQTQYNAKINYIDENTYEITWNNNPSNSFISNALSAANADSIWVSTALGCEAYYYDDGSGTTYCGKVCGKPATWRCTATGKPYNPMDLKTLYLQCVILVHLNNK